MKPNEISLNSMEIDKNDEALNHIGDEHVATSFETPLRPDAFDKDDDLKIELIEKHFTEIMTILGLDLEDESLSGTPKRVAKMYVKEVFRGLNPDNKPKNMLFENTCGYREMLLEKNIHFHSYCEHHFVPITGVAHCAYFSNGQLIGLSKINRIVHYYARRPQVQERLTEQIANELKSALQVDDVAVLIEAEHMCVSSRGVGDHGTSTITSSFHGKFREDKYRMEFLQNIKGSS